MADVLGFCRLDLRPASLWRVLAAVLLTSARYGGRDALLGTRDLCGMTGLAERTVKGAVAELLARGLLVRVGRSGRLRVDLSVAAWTRGADKLALGPADGRAIEVQISLPFRRADMSAPRLPVFMFLLLFPLLKRE